MPLNYNTAKCKPPTPTDDLDASVREALALTSMITGIPSITADNWTEVYARVHLLETVGGYFIHAHGEAGRPTPVPITPAHVHRWIGLDTNASRRTANQFLKILTRELQDYKREALAALKGTA